MAGYAYRPAPRTMEEEIFAAETRRVPADVVREVIRAADERAESAPESELALPVPTPRNPPSGTRRRVSPEEIAAFSASRADEPVVEIIVDEDDRATAPVPEADTRFGRAEAAPTLPLEAAACPPPRIEEARPRLLDRPVPVFLLSMTAVVIALSPVVYMLLR
jgi:hypothetical protein